MKIAFVGKGGSGKSTICSLYIRYLDLLGKKTLAIDADINVHLAHLLGIKIKKSSALSNPENTINIKNYLIGSNPHIPSPDFMVKSTPPGKGSQLIYIDSLNPIINKYSTSCGTHTSIFFVGTYDADGIGTSCYHNNLAIFENILSHTALKQDEWLITDMVAGTDAFSNTLHTQFDAIFMVVEPTVESVTVFKQYAQLAHKSKIEHLLFAIGNKVEDDSDRQYLEKETTGRVIAFFPQTKEIKTARRENSLIKITPQLEKKLEKIYSHALGVRVDVQEKLIRLQKLHKKYASQSYVVRRLGNIQSQIDPHFIFPEYYL